jgi:hypothetical protein
MLVSDCANPPEVCCVDLHAIATHLLTNVFDALLPCFAGVECDPLQAYVTLGNGDDGVADALSVAFTTMSPSQASAPGGRLLPLPLVRAQFTIRLLESGWPTAQVADGTIIAPDPVAQNEAARQSYAHGEAMYRKLLHMNSQRALMPDSVRGCGNIALAPLTPLPPRGGVVGWVTAVTVDVPFGGG